jgi:hypothetical protein
MLQIPRRDRIGGHVSVKKAAEVSGYTERHILYLVKTLAVDAFMISGVFLVSEKSLAEHAARSRRGPGKRRVEMGA